MPFDSSPDSTADMYQRCISTRRHGRCHSVPLCPRTGPRRLRFRHSPASTVTSRIGCRSPTDQKVGGSSPSERTDEIPCNCRGSRYREEPRLRSGPFPFSLYQRRIRRRDGIDRHGLVLSDTRRTEDGLEGNRTADRLQAARQLGRAPGRHRHRDGQTPTTPARHVHVPARSSNGGC